MRRGIALAAIGITLGLIGAFAGARYLQSMLFGIEPRDPGTFVAVAVMFAVVAAAARIPARAPRDACRSDGGAKGGLSHRTHAYRALRTCTHLWLDDHCADRHASGRRITSTVITSRRPIHIASVSTKRLIGCRSA